MRSGSRLAIGVLATYAACYAAFTWWRSYPSASNPHAFMKDPSRCAECHLEPVPAAGRPYTTMNFRKDLVALCDSCHPMHVSHPVDIAPGRGRGKNLPLDTDGTMTCITCHAPHSSPYSDRQFAGRSLFEKIRDTAFPYVPGRFRTYFLRIPSPSGEVCESCHALQSLLDGKTEATAVDPAEYAGAAACGGCHARRYSQWKKTPHARMLRSPRKDPSAVVARFNDSNPFPSSEIAYVVGSRNVQRFVSRKGDALVVRTPIWLIRGKRWNLSYWRESDWMKSCAGCHTTGFNPSLGQYASAGITCEACHGPGRAHARSGNPSDIVHPGKIAESRRAMICLSCHTTGHDRTGEYRFPVGYLPGEDLGRYYGGLTPKPGQDDTTFKGDGSFADRYAQYLFWRSRMLIVEGETCDLCKNFRVSQAETRSGGPRTMSAQEFCLSCHDGTVQAVPRHHQGIFAKRAPCLSCHPAERAPGGEPSIHDHKYIPREALSKNDFIPAPDFRSICYKCHPSTPKGA